MSRHVRGVLFVDYVRMIRGAKGVDWDKYLLPEDREIVEATIDPQGWYPMESFERFGVGILAEVARGQMVAVRMWGRFQLDAVRAQFPTLVAPDQPRDSLMRFSVLRKTFFDYDAVTVTAVHDQDAAIQVAYGMGAVAEEAASHQTMGFFERLVEVAGGQDVYARFSSRTWAGDRVTRIDLDWR